MPPVQKLMEFTGVGSGPLARTYLLLVVYGVIQLVLWLRKLWLAAVLSGCNRVLWAKDGVWPFDGNCLQE